MTDQRNTGKQGSSREDRLRQALRANLGRRKAQARARSEQAAQQDNNQVEQAEPQTSRPEGDD